MTNWLILRDVATGHVVYREPQPREDIHDTAIRAGILKTFPRATVVGRLSDYQIGFAARPLRVLSVYTAEDQLGKHRLDSSLFELWGCG